MYKRFIYTIAAASIAITGFAAAPARADNEDVSRALAAILGIAIVGAVIHDARKDKAKRQQDAYRVKQKPYKRPQLKKHHRKEVQPRPLPDRVGRKLLPASCLRTVERRNGNKNRQFGRRCLNNNYVNVHRLPQRCARAIETHRGLRRGFGVKCMRAEGYRLARH